MKTFYSPERKKNLNSRTLCLYSSLDRICDFAGKVRDILRGPGQQRFPRCKTKTCRPPVRFCSRPERSEFVVMFLVRAKGRRRTESFPPSRQRVVRFVGRFLRFGNATLDARELAAWRLLKCRARRWLRSTEPRRDEPKFLLSVNGQVSIARKRTPDIPTRGET